MSLFQWLVRPTPAPDATGKSLTGSDVAASLTSGVLAAAVAFAAAWPAYEATLKQLSIVVPEAYKPMWESGIASVALLVATGTQLYRMWKHDAPAPPSPEKK